MKEFLKSQRGKFVSLDEAVRNYPPLKFYWTAMPVVWADRDIRIEADHRRVLFLPGLIVHLQEGRGPRLVWYDPRYDYPFEKIQTKCEIITWKNVKDRLGKIWTCSEWAEYLYHLPTVLDPAAYKKKARKKIFNYATNLSEKYHMEQVAVSKDNLSVVKGIVEAWEKYNFSIGRVLPRDCYHGRYLYYFTRWMERYQNTFDALNLITYVDGIPFSVDCNYYLGNIGYGMTGVSLWYLFEEKGYPTHLNLARNMMEFRRLQEAGVEWYNTASGGTGGLTTFKSQYPHQLIPSYAFYRRRSK